MPQTLAAAAALAVAKHSTTATSDIAEPDVAAEAVLEMKKEEGSEKPPTPGGSQSDNEWQWEEHATNNDVTGCFIMTTTSCITTETRNMLAVANLQCI